MDSNTNSKMVDLEEIDVRFREWLGRNGVSLAIVLALIVAWETYTRYFNPRGDAYFPSIEYVVTDTLRYQDLVITGMRITATEIAIGYVFAVLIGISVGAILSKSFVIRYTSLPMLVYSYSLPAAMLAPLFVIWFDSNLTAAVAFVVWFAFFPIMINTMTGFGQVREELRHLGEITEATRWQMIRKIEFWEALPHISSGMKIAVQQSIIGAIIIEFIASTGGLGYLIVQAISLLRHGMLFGVVILLIAFSVVLYTGVSLLIDRFTPGP